MFYKINNQDCLTGSKDFTDTLPPPQHSIPTEQVHRREAIPAYSDTISSYLARHKCSHLYITTTTQFLSAPPA